MIINPFNLKENVCEEISFNKSKDKKIDIDIIQRYLVDNFLEELKLENRQALEKEIHKYIYNNYNIKEENKIKDIINKIFNRIFGYDILQKYIDNKDVSDIRVTSYNNIYVKNKGKWSKIQDSFKEEKKFYEYIRYCILKNNGNINYENPIIIVSDRKNKLRIEAGILPVNTISPSLTIRIHRIDEDLSLEKLTFKEYMLNYELYNFLMVAIKNKKSIVIAGKGGSGKTTILRAIINKISDEVPIVINEETTELYIKNKNVIEREILNNRKNAITLETLVKHSLVMSNDVIVIGEIKGAESLAFLDGISTGHVGLATVHSNSATDTIDRLITLVKKDIRANQYSNSFIAKMIATNIDYIIYMEDYKLKELIKLELKKDKINIINSYKLEQIKDNNFGYITKYKKGEEYD